MQKGNNNQLTSSRSVGMRDINALLQTAPISRIKTLRDDEGRSINVGQALPDNTSCLTTFFTSPLAGEVARSADEGEIAQGFTLIELLVVILIIGILAAVALPQYQKAVEKSRAAEAFVVLRAVYSSIHAYYLANGTYPSAVSQLDVQLPWTKTTNALVPGGWFGSSTANADWSLQLSRATSEGNHNTVYIHRISGPYKGAGFAIAYKPRYTGKVRAQEIVCRECMHPTDCRVKFAKQAGDYCKKIFGATKINTGTQDAWYQLPN